MLPLERLTHHVKRYITVPFYPSAHAGDYVLLTYLAGWNPDKIRYGKK